MKMEQVHEELVRLGPEQNDHERIAKLDLLRGILVLRGLNDSFMNTSDGMQENTKKKEEMDGKIATE